MTVSELYHLMELFYILVLQLKKIAGYTVEEILKGMY